jgi:hypothetical protein
MAWELKDQEWLTRIAAETAPPNDVHALLSDELWANAFSMWATDLGFAQGDYTVSTLHRVWVDLAYGTPGESIYEQHMDPSSGSVVQWPNALSDRFARAANGMDSDYLGALEETRRVVSEMLEPYVARFCQDVHVLQSENVSEPTPVPAKSIKPDVGAVDGINQMMLKELPEFRSDKANLAESRVNFYATPDVVLIGDSHPASYYEYLNAVGYTIGTITMMRRGSAFNPGRMEVGLLEVIRPGGQSYGDLPVPSQEDIRQAVTDAVGRVSNKEVRHNK